MVKLMQNMTKAELEAVEVDKKNWLEANTMYKTWPKHRIRDWLEHYHDADKREDFRRRLNVIRLNRKGK